MTKREFGFVHSPTPGKPSVYYDRLLPEKPTTKPPFVMIPGGAHSGACYAITADGRPGWAQALVARGYEVMLVDWPGCNRSGWVPREELTADVAIEGLGNVLMSLDRPAIVMTHSLSGPFGWKLLEKYGEKIERLVGIAPGPPGNIQDIPPLISEGENFVELFKVVNIKLDLSKPFVASLEFVQKKLIGDSRRFPQELVASYAATLNPVPQRLLYQRMNVKGSQVKITDFSKIKGKRVMIMTGSDDAEHPKDIDGAIVEWLNQNGAKADFIWLPDLGIEGNGHMIMMEDNSDELIAIVADWLEKP
jgi:pimeloyl-ACP methyl ester carboxylesterase